VEELAFWPHVRQALPNGGSLVSARVTEEVEAKQLAGEIMAMDPHDPTWAPKVKRLIAAVLDHAGSEQLHVFQPLRASVPVPDLIAWGRDLDQARS
jgi:hypothetical protein